MKTVGLDLAGVETRPTGFCALEDSTAEALLVYTDEEIVHRIKAMQPQIVAIDAPLSLPKGRKSIDERTSVHLRECDRELLRRGIRFFPITLGAMRKLTNRGIALRRKLESKGFKVIEVFPGGAQDVLKIPRKQHGLAKLRTGLENLGIKGLNSSMTDHELDAVTCAYVGKLFLVGKAEVYGTRQRSIIMPK